MHGPFSKILVGSPPPGSTPLLAGHWRLFVLVSSFLADRTNGRAYATVLRLSFCLHVRSFSLFSKSFFSGSSCRYTTL